MRATTNAVDRFFYGMNYSILRLKALPSEKEITHERRRRSLFREQSMPEALSLTYFKDRRDAFPQRRST